MKLTITETVRYILFNYVNQVTNGQYPVFPNEMIGLGEIFEQKYEVKT